MKTYGYWFALIMTVASFSVMMTYLVRAAREPEKSSDHLLVFFCSLVWFQQSLSLLLEAKLLRSRQ